MNEEILIEQYENIGIPKYSKIYEIIKELSRLYIRKSFVDYVKSYNIIDINLNLGKKILLSLSLYLDDINTDDYLFTIYRGDILLVMNSLPIKDLVNKLLSVQNKLDII